MRSREQETMVLPSGEKSTEPIARLCAFAFLLLRSSMAARGRASQLRKGVSGFGSRLACIPDFEGAYYWRTCRRLVRKPLTRLGVAPMLNSCCSATLFHPSALLNLLPVSIVKWYKIDCIPDFEGLVPTAGHNGLSVGREGHGRDTVAMGVGLLAHQSQGGRIYRQGGTRQSTFKAGS